MMGVVAIVVVMPLMAMRRRGHRGCFVCLFARCAAGVRDCARHAPRTRRDARHTRRVVRAVARVCGGGVAVGASVK